MHVPVALATRMSASTNGTTGIPLRTKSRYVLYVYKEGTKEFESTKNLPL